MSLSVRKFNTKDNIFENTTGFHRSEMEAAEYRKRTLKECRFKRDEFVSSRDKGKALAGAALGTLIPMLLFSQTQKKSLWKMKYGLKEIATMSIGANVGGISVSSIGKSKREKEKKYNEGIFQILNSILPMSLVDGGIKLCEKSKKLNNAPAKIAASTIGVVAGTQLGIKLANKITDPKDLRPDRRYTAKDAIANIDDAVSILVLGKVPFADKIHIEKALPFIYGYSGYRSGTSN